MALLSAGLFGCAETTPAPANRPAEAGAETPKPMARSQPESEPAPKPLPPFEHSDDTEYQNGLAKLLVTASVLGAKAVTITYRWGYITGIQEAHLFEASLDSKIRSTGCLAGALVVAGARGQIPLMVTREGAQPLNQFCSGLLRRDLDGYGPQGKLLSKYRLEVAEQAAAFTQDPRELDLRITIFLVGYNMGFAHGWEAVDHEAHAATTALDGCTAVRNITPPPSPALAHIISDKCVEHAQATRDSEPVRNMKCLLVGDEANADLSGLQFKLGCPTKGTKAATAP
jgi:hypothetical protein